MRPAYWLNFVFLHKRQMIANHIGQVSSPINDFVPDEQEGCQADRWILAPFKERKPLLLSKRQGAALSLDTLSSS
jgi:hypothetical protein